MNRSLLAILLAAPACAQQAPSIPPDRLMHTLRQLPPQRSAAGSADHWQGLRRTEELVESLLRQAGLQPTRQPLDWAPSFALRSERAPEPPVFHNIIADLPGTDLPAEVLIVAAHIDAVPASPGADDNASGVATLIEIARALADTPLRRTVRLAFFNLEEVGLVGSRQYVRDRLDPDQRIVGMISLEMLGYYTDAPGSQRSPIKPIEGVFDPPTVGDFIAVVGIKAQQPFSERLTRAMRDAEPRVGVLPVDFSPVPLPDMLRSDHAPFLLAGIPAVMITDTAEFRNPNYHRPTDTPDTLDPERLADTARAVLHAVITLAEPAPTGPDPVPAQAGTPPPPDAPE